MALDPGLALIPAGNLSNDLDFFLQTAFTNISAHIAIAPHQESPASPIHSLYNIPMLSSELLTRANVIMAPIGAFISALKWRLDSDADAAATFPPELHKALLDKDNTLVSTAIAPSIHAHNISQTPGFWFLGSLHNAMVHGLLPSPLTDILPLDTSSADVQSFLNSYEHAPFTSTLLHSLHFFVVFINAPVYIAAFPSLLNPLPNPLSQTEERRSTWHQHERIGLTSHPYRSINSSQCLPTALVAPVFAALCGNTVAEVCNGLGIELSSIQFKQYRGACAPSFQAIQLCLRVERLLHSLGYCSGKGGLDTQLYAYENGHEQSFAAILTELGWCHTEYQKKINLFYWAQNAVDNNNWRQWTHLHPSRDQSQISYSL
ncbi:hypothetical protein BT96DRAFT_1003908 [Gymnopus androsaceus JB14]|uniref:Uncharacterized protein n=1 Tax=Gymnopus androsaceus JB14 TaxID=1447944 RepID=A0A6A4GTT7_9AGAR|nr:hypothetical protein BT96DRAFT_1003908 [Gymnopus androsaceus JB14]